MALERRNDEWQTGLWVPNDSFRRFTAGRKARSLGVLVGTTLSTSRNIHNQSR